MTRAKTPGDATLLDVLVDGFEQNELLDGYYWRQLPLPDEQAAAKKFASLSEEVRRWKGPPARTDARGAWRLHAWPDLELAVAGRGIVLRIRSPQFADWWHDERNWQNDPLSDAFAWIARERSS